MSTHDTPTVILQTPSAMPDTFDRLIGMVETALIEVEEVQS